MPLPSIPAIVTSSCEEGQMGSVQTSSDKAHMPFRLRCFYLRRLLCQVSAKDFGSFEAAVLSKVQIKGRASSKAKEKETWSLSDVFIVREGDCLSVALPSL